MTSARRIAGEAKGREVTRNDRQEDPFDRAVALVLGPLAGGDLDRALADALALRDAAQRAADAIEKRISPK